MDEEFPDKKSLTFIVKEYTKREIIDPLKKRIVLMLVLVLPMGCSFLWGVFKAAYDAWENGFFIKDFLIITATPPLEVFCTVYSIIVGISASSFFIPIQAYLRYRIRSPFLVDTLSGALSIAMLFLVMLPIIVIGRTFRG